MTKVEMRNPKLEKMIHQEYFDSGITQNLFSKWCEVNSGTVPHFISRQEWEERKKNSTLFEQKKDTADLYIPTDLKMHEMLTLMEAAGQPERSQEIERLGKTFQNVAVYLAHRLDGIPSGREYAEKMIQGFYEYGRSLTERKDPRARDIEGIKEISLTSEEEKQVDEWLLGKEGYERRMKRVRVRGEDEDILERERKKLLQVYFTLLDRTKPRSEKDTEEPWLLEQAPLGKLREDIDLAIQHVIETPKRELFSMEVQRGVRKLLQDMRIPGTGWKMDIVRMQKDLEYTFGLPNIPFNYNKDERLLREELHIAGLKKELDDVRSLGDIKAISEKEIEIAQKIQDAVSKYPYRSEHTNPEKIRKMQYRNCVGGSLLGGELLRETGIGYGVGFVSRHSFLFFHTSDGRLFCADMLKKSTSNFEITYKDIAGTTVDKIIESIRKKSEMGIQIIPISRQLKNQISMSEQGTNFYLQILPPEYGQKVQVLSNLGMDLLEKGFREEAREAFELLLSMNPNTVNAYFGLARVFMDRNIRKEQEMLRRAVEFSPNDTHIYTKLAEISFRGGNIPEAIRIIKKALGAFKESESIYLQYRYGNLLEKVGRIKDALTQYLEIRKKNPEDIGVHIKLGNIYTELGLRKNALSAYSDALKINSEHPEIFYRIGVLQERNGDSFVAENAYESAIRSAELLGDKDILEKSQKALKRIKNKIKTSQTVLRSQVA